MHDFTGESLVPALSADNRVVTLSTGAGRRRTGGAGRRPHWACPGNDVHPRRRVGVEDWSGEYRQVGVRETHPAGCASSTSRTERVENLIDSTADVQAVAWFEDNRRIAAIVFHDGTGVLVTMNADGTGMRKMPLATQPSRTREPLRPAGREPPRVAGRTVCRLSRRAWWRTWWPFTGTGRPLHGQSANAHACSEDIPTVLASRLEDRPLHADDGGRADRSAVAQRARRVTRRNRQVRSRLPQVAVSEGDLADGRELRKQLQ